MERGYSKHMGGRKLSGLCAWNITHGDLNPCSTESEILEAAMQTAEMILSNTYGSYSDNSTYAVLRGTYAGSSNDGVCIKVDELISIETL
jgi:hypothetical protein